MCTMESEEAKNSTDCSKSARFPRRCIIIGSCVLRLTTCLEVNVVAAYPHMQQRPRTTNGRETTFKVAPMGPPNS